MDDNRRKRLMESALMEPFYDPAKFSPVEAELDNYRSCLLIMDVRWDGNVFTHETDFYLPHTNRDLVGWRPILEEDAVNRMGNWVYLDAAAEELVLARQQRDAVQRALDKANCDNDALRAELRAKDMIIDDLRQELSMANAGLRVALDPKRLVDGGEGYYEAWSAGGGE